MIAWCIGHLNSSFGCTCSCTSKPFKIRLETIEGIPSWSNSELEMGRNLHILTVPASRSKDVRRRDIEFTVTRECYLQYSYSNTSQLLEQCYNIHKVWRSMEFRTIFGKNHAFDEAKLWSIKLFCIVSHKVYGPFGSRVTTM